MLYWLVGRQQHQKNQYVSKIEREVLGRKQKMVNKKNFIDAVRNRSVLGEIIIQGLSDKTI